MYWKGTETYKIQDWLFYFIYFFSAATSMKWIDAKMKASITIFIFFILSAFYLNFVET